MQTLSSSVSRRRKDKKLASILALAGIFTIPGLHKFYLRQPGWGILYLIFSWTPIPRIASAIEGFWYLSQNGAEFDQRFNDCLAGGFGVAERVIQPEQVASVAQALRTLDELRRDGLISEYEFEQKRRVLLDQIG